MEAVPVADLSDAAERARRQALLDAPHMAPLSAFARLLAEERPGTVVPHADPLDGGAQAKLLFLLEKPSRRTDDTGFVSRDNPAPGAKTLGRMMAEAGVPREASLIWNAVPWWNGETKLTAAEERAGAEALSRLLALLPVLRGVVLVGRRAERAYERSGGAAVPSFVSAHFSGNVRAAFPERWLAIPGIWREAWEAVRD